MSRLASDLRDAAAVAFFALLVFAPFLGQHLDTNENYQMILVPTPELLAIAVALTFCGRLAMLQWHNFRPATPVHVTSAVAKKVPGAS